MQYITFLGKERPWRMTVLALETFCDMSGIKLADYKNVISNIDTKATKCLLWAGLVGGAKKEKIDLDITFEQFESEANDMQFEELVELMPREKNVAAPESGAM